MITFYNAPKIDLHGYDRDYARIVINDFIHDNYIMKQEKVIIIHGNGQNILKNTCQDTLKKNKYVKEYKINNFNSGETLVILNKSVDKK